MNSWCFCEALTKLLNGFNSKDDVGPRISRKVVLRWEIKLNGPIALAVPGAPARRRGVARTGGRCPWNAFYATETLKSLACVLPDQQNLLQHFPEETTAAELTRGMGGIHPFMVGCWACLVQNALKESGGQRCAAVFEEGHGWIRDALLHKRSQRLGAGCPPCFAEIATEFGKGSTGPERKRRRKA